MDWLLLMMVVAVWDIVRTVAVVLFTVWYTARKVRRSDEERG